MHYKGLFIRAREKRWPVQDLVKRVKKLVVASLSIRSQLRFASMG
jgi:hypothetical protein